MGHRLAWLIFDVRQRKYNEAPGNHFRAGGRVTCSPPLKEPRSRRVAGNQPHGSVSVARDDRQEFQGWLGPHGFRLWFWFDSQPIDEMFRDLTSPRGPDWDIDWKSEPYVEGSSWGWLIASRWNRLGFWWERQHYEWESGHRRRLLLIAAPFWFAGILLISGITAYELAKRKLSLTKRWSQLR